MGGVAHPSFLLLYQRPVPCIRVLAVSSGLGYAHDGGNDKPAERYNHVRCGDKQSGNDAENQMGDACACSAYIKMMQADEAKHKREENGNGFLSEWGELGRGNQAVSAGITEYIYFIHSDAVGAE